MDLTAPTAPTYTAPDSLQVGVAIAAMSPTDGSGIDEYTATGLPPGLSIAAATGVIDGTPDTADANTADATVTVSDTAGNTAEVSITFPAVARGDQTLTGFQYSASSVTFGSTAPTVTAPGGVETTLSYAATPSEVCTVDPSSGAVTLAGVGGCVITATAAGTDDYNETIVTFTVTVQAVGTLVLNLDAVATDDTVNIAEKTAGFTISGDTGSQGDVSVTVTVGATELTATSAEADPATWSVSVPADASYITGASVDVTVSATKTGYTAPDNVERTLTVDLTAPTAPTYTVPDSLQVGVAIAAMSPSDGIGIDEYSATGLPPGLSIAAATGVIGGTPDTADANTADATVTVSDTAGNTAEVSIAFPAVAKGDQTLTGFQYSASTVAFGSTAPTVTAPGGVVTTLSYSATPSTVCTVAPSSGAVTLVGVGGCVITATAAGTDDYNGANATFTVTVQAVGTLVLNLDAVATDNTINIDENAAGFAISGDTGSEAGVSVTVAIGTGSLSATSAADNGTATWSVSVPADANYITGTGLVVEVNATKTGFTAPAAITRTVTVDLTAPTAPTYTAPASLKVGVAIAAMSPTDGSGIDAYSATGLPPGLSIAAATGVIGGTPDTADANTADATVTVSDTAGNTAEVSIAFPAVAKGDQTLTGFQYSASTVAFGSTAPTVTAPGGVVTTLSYSATPSTVCTVAPSSGALTLVGVGGCVITATAAGTDDYNGANATFTVTVQAVGTLVLNLDAVATDNTINIDENAAGFAISGDTGSEAGVSVTVAIGTGSLSATSAADNGTATWSVSVPADANYITGTGLVVEVNATKTGFTAPAAITRTVTVDLTAPTAPTYTAPASLKVGVAIAAMSPTDGSGIDAYSATGLPSGLSIDTGTGVIGGTPDTADANTADATVTVSDAAGNTAEVSIAFPAVASDEAPSSGVALSVTPTALDEDGSGIGVTVTGTLDGATRDEPTTVTVSVGASDDAAIAGTDYVAVDDLSLTIPAGQASGTASFTFTPLEDLIDERVEAVSITGATEVEDFEVSGTTLSIDDNDERGVTVSPSDLSVSEGASATYTVVLDTEPTGTVTVTPSLGSGDTDVTVSAALTFTATDWNQAQTVTVSAAQDTDAANDTATIEHAIAGADYGANGATADDVAVTVEDDEAAVTLTVNPTAVDEDAEATTVTVTGTLDGATSDAPMTLTVSVGVSDDAATEGTDYAAVNDLSLTIPSGQTSGTATFTLTTMDDFIDEPDEAVSVSGTIEDTGFEVIGTTVAIADNDERGVQISPSSLTVSEGGDATYTVVLTSEPTGDVTVTPSLGSGDTDVTVSAALTFTPTDWNQAQTVTVSAARDVDAANDTATIGHAIAGADYGANSATADDVAVTADDVAVTVEDDETAVTLTVNPTTVDEDGGGTTVTVTGTLDGVTRDAPTTLTVSVGAADDAAAEGTDYAAVNDLSLTIPTGQASGTATFTLTVTDDVIDEPDEAVSITGTSQDAGFEVIGTTLAITDNDERGVTVSPTDMTLAEGASATYTVVLDTEPTETVTVTPSVIGSPDLTFTPSSLTFTSSDWDTAKTVTVSATEDDDAYHDSSSVSHVAEGAEYASLVDGELSVTISDNEVTSQGALPAQVTDVSATATATHVDLTWSAVQDTVLGYRVEASYDGGANWAEVEANTESTDSAESTDSTETIETSYRHDVGLNLAETRRYRVSAVSENGAGLPSVSLQASATSTTGGLTAIVAVPGDTSDTMPEDAMESMSEDTTDSMLESTAAPAPAIDLCWIPQGMAASELSDIAMAWTPVHSSGSDDLSDLSWQSIGSGSSQVDCEDGIGVRVTSINENQRYAFRMRANHAGVWLISNDAEAMLVESSKPLRAVVTAGASGLSGDTPVPDLVCRDYDDPATREDDAGSFLLSIGFTTASAEYLRYEPVNDFDPASDLTLVNATAELLDRPYDTRLGYRLRITPSVWGEPVLVSVPADVVTHGEMSAGNQASAEFRRETTDAVDCDTATPEPAHRSQVVAVAIEADGDRNGEWTAGEPIRVTLQFDEPVRVTTTDGIPGVTLTLGEVGTMGQTPDGEAATDATEQSSDGEAATEQSSDGEAAVDVTVPFSLVAHEDTLVFEHMVTADQSPIRDITLLADSLSLNGGQIDSFSGPAVGLAHAEAAVVGGQIVQPDLTAGWSTIPGAHEGSETSFEIHLQFSEDVDLVEVIGEQNLLDHAFTVTNGAIVAIGPARDRQGEFFANRWAMRVVPDSDEPVTISPVVELACDQPGAICTIDDRPLTEAPSVTIHRTEQGLSVADAEVGEGPGAVLVFEVTLARAADEPVTVDYETADGTATAGEDYEAVSGTLSIEAGQTSASVRVSIIDDSHDEGEETLTLVLSNASNARIHDGVALGIIVNSDPIPAAWLARFGRAASDHVAQAVARRLERGPSEEHMTLGGLRLDRLYTSLADPDGGRAAPTSTHMDLDSLGSGAMQPPLAWSATGSGNNNAALAGSGSGTGSLSFGPTGGFGAQGPTSGFEAQWSSGGMAAPYARTSRDSDALPSLRDALMGSSFFHTFGDSEDTSSAPLTAWGETASTRFKGSEGALSLDGEVTTAILGLDKRYGRWLVGSALSYSEGEGGYQGSGALGGSMDSTLTSLNPYAHFELNETTSLWGVFGYGIGSLRVTPQGAASAIETDLSNRMAAFGGRGLLSVRTGDAGRFELALRSDALVTRTDSDAVQGLAGAQGATSRVRLILEGSGSIPLSTGGVLKPSLEAGLRYDGGDAETGAGIELGGELGYAVGSLSVEVNARALMAHEDTDYEEWGFSGSLAYTPGKDGRGLSMKLGSAWGSTQSGVQSLWTRQDASGLAGTSPFEAAQRFQAELGYGIAGRRKAALWVPFIAAQAADGDSQSLRMGVKLTSGPNVEAGLELGRRPGRAGTDPEHAVQLRGTLRW